MRRILPAVLLGALALAGSAAAASPLPPPYVLHTVVGGHFPIRVRTSVTPPVALFGDAVTATVVVLADRKWVDPSRLTPLVGFAPYEPVAPPTKLERQTGRLVVIHWRWKLRCLTVKCVPITPPSDLAHIFHFRKVSIEYRDPGGKVVWLAPARFPAVQVMSDISPAIVSFLNATQHVKWTYQITPAAVSYRVSPAVVFWIAVLLSGICVAAALAITTRWVLRLRSPAPAAAPGIPASSLEQALTLFFWAGRHGDETLQRKALERVAAELPIDVSNLSDVTRELAWSPETPEEDEVEAISEQAGVPAHQEDGAGR